MDRRVAKSRAAVQDAFVRLLARKRYSAITVQEILNEANVGRSTFYAHFQGKDELLQALVDSICDHALAPREPEPLHDFSGKQGLQATVEHILCHIKEQDAGVRALLKGESASAFTRHLRESFARHALDMITTQLDGVAAARADGQAPACAAACVEREFLAHHVAGSLVELVLCWAEDCFREDERVLARNYVTLVAPLFTRE